MSAPKIPNNEKYWLNKGKSGKNVVLHFHDDLDGIYSAIVMKNYLLKKKFNIVAYNIVNYQDGWFNTYLNKKYINIALDFSEYNPKIDVFIDHHGNFEDDENKNAPAIKMSTSSAYEAVCYQLGLPVDSLVLNVIDMVDSAKYDYYNIDVKEIINFNFDKKNKLEFAAAFNQMLKRSDFKTSIEVVHNTNDINPSIYNIYRLFKILYPNNNINKNKLKREIPMDMDIDEYIDICRKTEPEYLTYFEKDFIEDGLWRLDQVKKRTRGENTKKYIKNQKHFKELFKYTGKSDKIFEIPGYQIIGNLIFVPSGTWANAPRLRAIIEKDQLSGVIPKINYIIDKKSPLYNILSEHINEHIELIGDISIKNDIYYFYAKYNVTHFNTLEGIQGKIIKDKNNLIFVATQPLFFMLLQYGNTLQIATLHKFENYDRNYLPRTKNGDLIDNLNIYTKNLLNNFIEYFNYNPDLVKRKRTKSGGHTGIGTINNIFGEIKDDKSNLNNVRYLDIIKNKIISDLSGVKWGDMRMKWNIPEEDTENEEDILDKRTVYIKDIRNANIIKEELYKYKFNECLEKWHTIHVELKKSFISIIDFVNKDSYNNLNFLEALNRYSHKDKKREIYFINKFFNF